VFAYFSYICWEGWSRLAADPTRHHLFVSPQPLSIPRGHGPLGFHGPYAGCFFVPFRPLGNHYLRCGGFAKLLYSCLNLCSLELYNFLNFIFKFSFCTVAPTPSLGMITRPSRSPGRRIGSCPRPVQARTHATCIAQDNICCTNNNTMFLICGTD
jgi:hypothetical protein